jgi:catechol 2,3-dioxygenase-like lactoylglutathione lyase family enzyme
MTKNPSKPARFETVVPILVRDVGVSAKFFEDKLGFETDFLHGTPPYYGSVSRDGVCLHLRFVHQPVFAEAAKNEPSLTLASFEVSDVAALHAEFEKRGADIAEPLTQHDWGGTTFHVRDPDGNVVSFVTYG